MPQVPIYQRTERQRPVNQQGVSVQASPGDFGAQIGQGMQTVAQGINDLSTAYTAVKAKEAETLAKQADNALAEWDRDAKYNPETGYMWQRGEAAVTGQQSYQNGLKTKREEIAATLPKPAQELFNNAADSREKSSFEQAIRHAGEQRKQWFENASKSRQDSFANDALTEYTKPEQVNRHIASGIMEIQNQAREQGLPPETIQAQSETYESSVRRNVILRMAETDPLAAKAELERMQGRMLGSDTYEVGKALKVGVSEAEAKQKALEINQKLTGGKGGPTRFAASGLPRPAYNLLGVISGVESPRYDMKNGGEKFASFNDHPRSVGKGGSSTAAGRYQFVKGTWDRVAGTLGLPDFSPENQDRGAWWLAQADYKSRTGSDLMSDINAGNYSKVRAGLAPTWEGIAHLTDEQFAARMMSADKGGVAVDPTAMAAEVNSIQDPDMRARVERQLSGEIAQQKAEYKTYSDTIGLKILQHQVTSESDILNDPILSIGDKETHIRAYRTEQEKGGNLAESMAAFASGRFQPDPYDEKGRDATDKLFTAAATSVAPEKLLPVTEEIVRQSGVVPKPIMSNLRQGIESRNPADVMAAAQQAVRFSQINPSALSRREGGKEIQAKADDFNHMVNTLNMTPEQAAQRIADNNDPEKQRDRKTLEPAAKEFKKTVENEDVGALFDDSILPFNDPKVGFNEAQAFGIKADFLAIAEEQFYLANGDPTVAMNRAKQEMKRIYGVTEITGSKVVMKHPPERYWPQERPEGFGQKVFGNSFDWAIRQLGDDIYAIDKDVPKTVEMTSNADGTQNFTARVDLSKVQFVTTPETDKMVKRGEMPAYQVMYTDKNGVLQTIPGKMWRPDAKRILDRNSVMEKELQEKRLKNAREVQPDERKRAALQNSEDGGREASLDAFLEGPDTIAIDKVKP